MEDSALKKMFFIVLGAIIAGKLFATSMVKLAEKTSTTPVTHWLSSAFGESNKNDGPLDSRNNLNIIKAQPLKSAMTKPVTTVHTAAKPEIVVKDNKPVAKLDAQKKKKKKEKKAQEIAKPFPAPPPQATFTVINPKQNPDVATAYTGGPAASSYYVAPAISLPNNGQPVSTSGVDIAYWTNLLVHNPSTSAARQFYQLYVTKQITDQQFYSVLGFMVKSPIQDARLIAVLMAARQQREESFHILADEAYTDNISLVSAQAQAEVAKYAVPNAMSIMVTALASGDVYEKVAATQTVQTTATQFASTSASTDPRTIFGPLVAPLESLTHDSANMVRDSATRALAAVTNLLNITVTASNQGL